MDEKCMPLNLEEELNELDRKSDESINENVNENVNENIEEKEEEKEELFQLSFDSSIPQILWVINVLIQKVDILEKQVVELQNKQTQSEQFFKTGE